MDYITYPPCGSYNFSKFRTMKELCGGTKEEFEEPTKACTFATSLCVTF